MASATSGNSGAKEAKETAIRSELKELYHKVCCRPMMRKKEKRKRWKKGRRRRKEAEGG